MTNVNAAFDSGNIRLVEIDGNRIDLEIVKDNESEFFQWFYFRVAGAEQQDLRLRILNAGQSAYPFGWPGYMVRASTDRKKWRMIPTRYEDGVLEFDWTGDSDVAWFAYFAPYTTEMHADLVARTALLPGMRHQTLGLTLDGQAIDSFTIGEGTKQIWIYARQHPGESMTEFWIEGALEWLASEAAAGLRNKATIHVVPNMNPDGTRRGHLRTNAAGVNLNREWHEPTPERSPEVFCVRGAMDETGVDVAMDIHGDEAIPANFLAGYDGIPSWSDEHGARFYDYARRLAEHTAEFQTERGYEKAKPGTANLSMSTNQVAERFGALAMTLEMPFKDHDPKPDPEFGWSPERSRMLAVAMLETLDAVLAGA